MVMVSGFQFQFPKVCAQTFMIQAPVFLWFHSCTIDNIAFVVINVVMIFTIQGSGSSTGGRKEEEGERGGGSEGTGSSSQEREGSPEETTTQGAQVTPHHGQGTVFPSTVPVSFLLLVFLLILLEL